MRSTNEIDFPDFPFLAVGNCFADPATEAWRSWTLSLCGILRPGCRVHPLPPDEPTPP